MRTSAFKGFIFSLALAFSIATAEAASLNELNDDLSNFNTVVEQMVAETSVVEVSQAIADAGINLTLENMAFLVSLSPEDAMEIIAIFTATIAPDQQEAFLDDLIIVIAKTVPGIDKNKAFAALANSRTFAAITPVSFGLTALDGSCSR
jgi:hypothetical protein